MTNKHYCSSFVAIILVVLLYTSIYSVHAARSSSAAISSRLYKLATPLANPNDNDNTLPSYYASDPTTDADVFHGGEDDNDVVLHPAAHRRPDQSAPSSPITRFPVPLPHNDGNEIETDRNRVRIRTKPWNPAVDSYNEAHSDLPLTPPPSPRHQSEPMREGTPLLKQSRPKQDYNDDDIQLDPEVGRGEIIYDDTNHEHIDDSAVVPETNPAMTASTMDASSQNHNMKVMINELLDDLVHRTRNNNDGDAELPAHRAYHKYTWGGRRLERHRH